MKLMLDTKKYDSKPTDPWNIGKRIVKNPVDISPEQLGREIISGKTFIPAFLNTSHNGHITRNAECWTSTQLIALDFDDGMLLKDALIEFSDTAMFIYTTFSHTEKENRFRVVFGLEKVIEDYELFKFIIRQFELKYKIDGHCKDGVRLFYGGKKLYEINYNNKLYIDNLIRDYRNSLTYQGELQCRNNSNINNNITIVPIICEYEKSVENKGDFDGNFGLNVKYIKERDISKLRRLIGLGNDYEAKVFYTLYELKEYLFSQDLGAFLGVKDMSRFNCHFHHDRNPSAGIIFDHYENKYIYKCFSSNCNFRTGLIIKCTETILNCDYMETLEFLMQVYNIKYKETEWQIKQKRKLDYNKQYIQSDEFKIEYPELYKRIKKYINQLDGLLDIARLNMPPEHYTNEQIENLFFVSVRHFANRMGKGSLGQITNEIALFVYLGLVGKLRKDEIPKDLLDRAEDELKRNKNKFKSDEVSMISFFHIPSYNQKILNFGESKAIEFKEKKFTMRGWSREMLYRGLGESEANRVYPQLSEKRISDKSHKSANLIESVTLRLLENQGWTTEQHVVNTVVKNYKSGKEYTKTQIKRIMAEMLDKYDIEKRRLTKELREKLKISNKKVKGSPSIFYKSE